jgi:hypothetical protein
MKKIIGIGAAGNKMAIRVLNDLDLDRTDFALINTTMEDIPAGFEDLSIKIGSGIGGAGKEPSRARNIVIDAMKQKTLDLREVYNTGTYDGVILLTSTEGGTGSGATPVIAKFFRDQMNVNVTIIAVKGFGLDPRGQKNYVEFFKHLQDNYTIQIICNEKFLDRSNNILKAEEDCNLNIVNRVAIILGIGIISGDTNIDEFDLYKSVNTPGYQNIEKKILKSINNRNDFDDAIADMIDSSKSIPSDNFDIPRLSIIYNLTSEKIKDCIDYKNTVVRQKIGEPYEVFSHVQNVGDCDYVCMMFSGMKLPFKSIKDTHEEYLAKMEKINKAKDTFFSEINMLETDDDSFDMGGMHNSEKGKDTDGDFFANLK